MNDAMNQYKQFRNRILLLNNSIKLEQIHKGYSSDGKYIVYGVNSLPKYILRTYSIDQDKDKRLEFSRLKLMEKYDVKCSRPIEIGVLPDQKLGYMIVSFICCLGSESETGGVRRYADENSQGNA